MARALANPTVEVNSTAQEIVPNSITVKLGKGDKNVRTLSAGGNSVSIVVTENAETKKSMLSFSLFNTTDAFDKIKSWQDSTEGNTIRLSESDVILNFRQMHLITDPEYALGADGDVTVEFEGAQAL